MSRKESRSGSFAWPLFGIFLLLASYWLLADWHQVPVIINSALTMFHWPV